jgi:anti-sigma regulatory factor (Ser/Thr protein kinase)
MGEPAAVDTLRLSSRLADLARLYPWLADAAARHGLPPRVVFAMQVALEEAAGNAARHGFAPGAAGEIAVWLTSGADEAALVVADTGAPFNPILAAPRSPPTRITDMDPGGQGLRLLRHYCSAVSYERRDGWNQLTLRFALPGRDARGQGPSPSRER